MVAFISIVLTIIAVLIAIPVVVFCVEVIASLTTISRNPKGSHATDQQRHHNRIAVLIPAHDESKGLLPTLADVKPQILFGDRLLVVADNCTDDTADVARIHGAEVIERNDRSRRGKGYALDFGLWHLSLDPPEIVIMIDADCRVASGAIDEITKVCAQTRRPVQALYLMSPPADAQINYQVADFAWRVKNSLRPAGLRALGLPCQLMGTGMAFPWDVIRAADLATGSIVEDLRLGLELARSGHPPIFCPSAMVTSQFASSARAARSQRKRWEHGHLHTIATTVPKLLSRAIVDRDVNLLALTLDLSVPPLSLLAGLVGGIFAVTVLFGILVHSSVSVSITSATLIGFLIAVGLAWQSCARDILPIRSVLLIAPYVVGKFGLYRRFSKGEWVRTDRSKSE
jgi:cellulose synthase/poly-beta-1,6-N-acetylglucosamine synthase-like glycosyltransferase